MAPRHTEWLSQWLVTSRHSVHLCASVRNHPKSSLSQQRNRLDAITTGIPCDSVAILVEKGDDFCYNRDEKRRKSRVSVVLSFPQVVGNAITSTIATLHQHKKVKRKINLVPGFSDLQGLECNSNPTFWCREPERGHEPDTK